MCCNVNPSKGYFQRKRNLFCLSMGRGKKKNSIVSTSGETSNYLIPKGKHVNFNQLVDVETIQHFLYRDFPDQIDDSKS